MFDGFMNFINGIILVLLAIATLLQILDMCGFLPKKLKERFKLSHAQDTITVLKELGVDVDLYRKNNRIVGLPKDYSRDNIEKDTLKNLEKLKMDINVSVGKTRQTKYSYYFDLIGYSCNPIYAEAYARLLCSFWIDKIESTSEVRAKQIDFVVTPKGGSPILGYEFAKLINKPFVLHEGTERFHTNNDDMRIKFNCAGVPMQGSTALIVDDSTTGGKMVLETIKDLRKYGYMVSECLVVFEPQQKDARKKLWDQNVNLLSIVKTHN